jgi:uncharacterized membrane protein
MPDEKAQAGLNENTASALAYITIIPAIIFLLVAPYNQSPNIRFHAWQSLFLNISLFVIGFVNVLPIIGQLIFLVIFIALFVGWLMAVLKALKGERLELPVIGKIAAKQAGL